MKNWVGPLFFLIMSIFSSSSLAASGITYHGKILRTDGSPIDGQFVGFRLRIMDGATGSCQMYEEIQTKDMRNSNGVFSIIIGDGSVVGTYGVTGLAFFDGLFQNSKTFNFSVGHLCELSPYNADARDGRKFNVSFRESPGDPWEDMPTMSIEHVPFAYSSLVSQKVGNHGDGSLLRVENAGTPSVVSALTPTQYTNLVSLANGSSTQYIQSVLGTASQITVNTVAGVATVSLVDVATAGTYGSATQIPVFVLDAKGRITSVTNTTISGAAPTGAAGGDLTGTYPNPEIGASAVTDAKLAADSVITAKILDGNVTLNKLATDSVNSAKIVDASIVGADISSTATLSVASVTATGALTSDSISTRSIGLFELPVNGVNYVAHKAPDNLTGNTTYTWPAAAPASNMILQSDNTGTLSWVAAGGGGSGDFLADGSVPMTGTFKAATGTAALPSMTFAGDTDTGFFNYTANGISLATNGAEKVRFGNNGSITAVTAYYLLSSSSSQASPTFSFASDTNTGVFQAAADVLGFTTNGSEKMRIDSSGNVGIGTSSSGAKLDVKGSFSMSGSTSGAVTFTVPVAAGSATYTWPAAAPASNMLLQSDNTGTLSWVAGGGGAGDFLANGTVPMTGAITIVAGGAATPGITFNNDADSGFYSPAAGNVHVVRNGTEMIKLGHQYIGYLNAGAVMTATANAEALPTYTWAGDPDTGMYKPAVNEIGFSTNATEKVRINSIGNMGIGEINPAYKLDVAGDVNVEAASAIRFGGTSVCTSTGCTSSSDRNLKKNIKKLEGSLEKVLQLQGVEYDYKDTKKFTRAHQIGVIAQDVESIFPEVVTLDPKTGYRSVAYDHLVAPLIESIKALYSRLVSLEESDSEKDREILQLKRENLEMKQRIKDIENRLNLN